MTTSSVGQLVTASSLASLISQGSSRNSFGCSLSGRDRIGSICGMIAFGFSISICSRIPIRIRIRIRRRRRRSKKWWSEKEEEET